MKIVKEKINIKCIRKYGILCTMLALLLFFSRVQYASAATASWTLQHLTYAPTSESIWHWNKTVTATSNLLVASMEYISGDPQVDFAVSGKSYCALEAKGSSAKLKATKGKRYKVQLTLSGYSTKKSTIARGNLKY